MPREYKQKAGINSRKRHDKATVEKAVDAVKSGMSLRNAEKQFRISKTVIARHKADPNVGSRQRHVLLGDVENMTENASTPVPSGDIPWIHGPRGLLTLDSWTLRLMRQVEC